jgi:type I restriction enzyme S subunit
VTLFLPGLERLIRVRPGSQVDPIFLSHFFDNPSYWSQISLKTAGAAQPGVNSSKLKDLEVPLPPLDEQKRIAAILDQADEIRRLRQRAIARLNGLGQAIFYQMFGDPKANPMNWSVEELGKLCDLVRGSSPRPQGDPRYFGGDVPRLMIADITRDGMNVTPRIDSPTEEGAKRSRPMPAGSVVMAVSGAVGLPAILTVDACIHDGFVGFRSLKSRIDPMFLYNYLLINRIENSAQGTGAIWVNLTTDQVKSFLVPVPPYELQMQYKKRMTSIDLPVNAQRQALSLLEELFASLQQRAFQGEL